MNDGAPLAALAYRPRAGTIGLGGAFFGMCALVLGHKHATTGELEALLGALGSGGFVLISLLLLAMRVLRPQQIRVFPQHIELPAARFTRAVRRVELDTVEGIDVVRIGGQASATVRHPGGPSTIQASMLPEDDDFDDLIALLETGRWRAGAAAGPGGLSTAPPGPPATPAAVARARAGLAGPWRALGMKLGALATFCGGPLHAADTLGPVIGRDPAFGVAFTPVALLLFGSFAVLEDAPSRWTRGVVAAGSAGALAIGASDAWALLRLARGAPVDSPGLVAVGSTLGLGLVAAYGWAAAGFGRTGPRR